MRAIHAFQGPTRARDHRLALSVPEAPLMKTATQQQSAHSAQRGLMLVAVRPSATHVLQVRSTATSAQPRHVLPVLRDNRGKLAL